MPKQHHVYKFQGGQHYIAYSVGQPSSTICTLLILHGIGDSSDNYTQFLEQPVSENINILIPDLLGFGNSICDDRYKDFLFDTQLKILLEHIDQLSKERSIHLGKIIVMGHSMGGDLSVLLCRRESFLKPDIVGLVNVEGSLTKDDTFVSRPAYEAAMANEFELWFDKYQKQIAPIFKNSGNYLKNLSLCNREAFKQSAVELYKNCLDAKHDQECLVKGYTHLMSKFFIDIKIHKIFIYGDATDENTRAMLEKTPNLLSAVKLTTDTHWLMLTCFTEFNKILQQFISQMPELKNVEHTSHRSRPRL